MWSVQDVWCMQRCWLPQGAAEASAALHLAVSACTASSGKLVKYQCDRRQEQTRL